MFYILDANEEELSASQVKMIHSAMLSALKGVTYLLSEVSYGYMKLVRGCMHKNGDRLI